MDIKTTIKFIRKRNDVLVEFKPNKIVEAIFNAAKAVGGTNREIAEQAAAKVVSYLEIVSKNGAHPTVEIVQDMVEKILIEEGHAKTAKAYILYRAKRTSIREGKSELMDTMEDILNETSEELPYHFLSPSAKMLKVATAASINYYLSRIIPSQYADAHRKGEIHIQSLEYYCKTADSVQIPFYKIIEKLYKLSNIHKTR